MSEEKISALPAATSITSSDIVPVVQGGTTKKAVFSARGCTLVHPDGTNSYYPPSANTDVARGTAFKAAIAAAATGDTIIVGTGTYDCGDNYVADIPASVFLKGAGMYATTLKSNGTGGGPNFGGVVLGAGAMISDIGINMTGAGVPLSSGGATGLAVNCYILSNGVDSFSYSGSGSFKLISCVLNTSYVGAGDGNFADVVTSNNATGITTLIGCHLTADGGGTESVRVLSIGGSAGRINAIGCDITAGNGLATAYGASVTNAGATIELTSCVFRTSGTGAYDLFQSAGTINAINCSHSGGGELTTSGLVNIGLSGVLPGLAALSTANAITLVGSWTTTAVVAGQRSLQTLDLGVIGNPSSVLVALYPSSVADADVPKMLPSYSGTGQWTGGIGTIIDVCPAASGNNLVLVSEDYTKTSRMSGVNAEKYGASSVMPSLGRTYADFGVGVLYGWYSTANSGVMGINKKVQIESMWLTQSTTHTTLNVAFFNTDAADSNTVTVKIAVIK